MLIEKNKTTKDILIWELAHWIVGLAKVNKKAIVMEDLTNLSKNRMTKGKRKLRKRFHQFIYKKILRRIEILAKRNGIEVIIVNPAFTSVIGQLKYSPQYSLNKDIASAFTIGRRGMGFKEDIPKNYLLLLKELSFLKYSLHKLKEIKLI